MRSDATWSTDAATGSRHTHPSPFREAAARPVRFGARVGALAKACWGLRHERIDAADHVQRAERLRGLATTLCDRHEIVADVMGVEPAAGSVVVANHVSYADALVLPRLVTAACIAKQELAEWPFIGAAASRLGVVFVDRACASSGAGALRRCARLLANGVSVIVFPEGTTTHGDRLLPFKRGIFGLARQVGAPIVPAALRYDDPRASWVGDEAFVSHYARTIGTQRATKLSVWLGPALRPRADDRPEALAAWARTWIARRLAVPLTDEPEPALRQEVA